MPPANGGNTDVDEQISPTVSLREWDFFDYMSGNVIKETEQLICTFFPGSFKSSFAMRHLLSCPFAVS